MITIISITNAHEYEGITITAKQFETLIEALLLSRYTHTVKYTRDGNEFTMFVK